jgi:Fe-S cluster biosynthesis and repair protein YggX
MDRVHCSRCGNDGEVLDRPPLPGVLGERVVRQTCASCWQEWLGAQVILINENRLSGADSRHVDYLLGQMQVFLNLQEDSG